MKKIISLVSIKMLYLIFLISTIISVIIIYTNRNNKVAIIFLIGYIIATSLSVCYLVFITIMKTRKLKWVEIKKRIYKFIIYFILFGTLNYISDYFFRPSEIDLVRNFSIALGLAFGISFIDIIFIKKKESQNRNF